MPTEDVIKYFSTMIKHVADVNRLSLQINSRNDASLILPMTSYSEIVFNVNDRCYQSTHAVGVSRRTLVSALHVSTRCLEPTSNYLSVDFNLHCREEDSTIWFALRQLWHDSNRDIRIFWDALVEFASYRSGLNKLMSTISNQVNETENDLVIVHDEHLITEEVDFNKLYITISAREDKVAFATIDIPYALFKHLKKD